MGVEVKYVDLQYDVHTLVLHSSRSAKNGRLGPGTRCRPAGVQRSPRAVRAIRMMGATCLRRGEVHLILLWDQAAREATPVMWTSYR